MTVESKRLLTEDRLRLLNRIHWQEQISVRGLAKRLHSQFGFRHPDSLRRLLSKGWRELGLDVRSQSDGARLYSAGPGGVERCRKGHLYSAENTYLRSDGGRRCRVCRNALQRRAYRRRKFGG